MESVNEENEDGTFLKMPKICLSTTSNNNDGSPTASPNSIKGYEEHVEATLNGKAAKEPYHRQSEAKIRNRIQDELRKYRPMTCHELHIDLDIRSETVMRHLKHLQMLGVVQSFEGADGEIYWKGC